MGAMEVISRFEASGGQDSWPFIDKKSKADIEAASALRLQGHKVCLFINADMLEPGTQNNKSLTPDHWVVLSGPVNFFEGDRISLTVFTWGDGLRAVPRSGDLSLSSFLNNFHGYVAAI